MSRTPTVPLWFVLALAVATSACRKPDPAPEELTDLLRFTWSHYDIDDPTHAASLADASANMEAWFAGVSSTDDFDPEEGYSGTLIREEDRLSEAELEGLEPAPAEADGSSAVGVVVAMETGCTLADIDRLYLIDDQTQVFPDNYLAYERSGQEYDCYQSEECLEAVWISTIENELVLDITSHFSLRNQMRRFEAEAPDGTVKRGRALRAWMMEEAELTPSNLGHWYQNYQLELIVETDTGVLHVYPQWVEAEFGAINTEASTFLNGYIDGLRDYIVELEANCLAR